MINDDEDIILFNKINNNIKLSKFELFSLVLITNHYEFRFMLNKKYPKFYSNVLSSLFKIYLFEKYVEKTFYNELYVMFKDFTLDMLFENNIYFAYDNIDYLYNTIQF